MAFFRYKMIYYTELGVDQQVDFVLENPLDSTMAALLPEPHEIWVGFGTPIPDIPMAMESEIWRPIDWVTVRYKYFNIDGIREYNDMFVVPGADISIFSNYFSGFVVL